MCAAVGFFTCIDTSAKWLILFGLPTLQVVFARYFGHFVLALLFYVPREGRAALVSNAPAKQVLRSLFLLGSTVMNFMALKHLPITITIFFAGPHRNQHPCHPDPWGTGRFAAIDRCVYRL